MNKTKAVGNKAAALDQPTKASEPNIEVGHIGTSKRYSQGFATGVFGLVANLILSVAKLIVGAISGSIAVIADGVNNLTDASSALVVLIGFKIAAKSKDADHPHGHGRAEYIGGMIVSFFIFIAVLALARSSIQSIIQPEPVNFSYAVLVVLVISIIAKAVMAFVYYWRNRALKSVLISAAARDSLSDVAVTSVVFAAALLARSTGIAIDGVAGLIVVVFVAYQAIRAFTDSLSLLLGRAADPKKLAAIRELVLKNPAFTQVVGIDFHDYGENYQRAYIKVKIKYGLKSAQVRRAIEDTHLTLQNLQNIDATFVYWY
ncbi:MAG: cation diffusion facilitator family transporter [Candidatus Nomurabacteria bacterium]|jgi:cation diffusion facilitator family transporter|nr:cation diffusion facilitator family transporter [Candidatus Nomurabacteria bacterium]